MIRIGNSEIDSVTNQSISSADGSSSEIRPASPDTTQKSDSVSLANGASLVALAKAGSASRELKVQSLSAEIKSGRYQADTGQVGQAIVQGHITA